MTAHDNPEEFESLRKILSVKSHEVPPPGYFNTLSSKICSRIEAREEAPAGSLFQRLLAGGIKPVLAYSFVLSVCSLIAYTVNSFLNLEPQPLFATDSPTVNKSRSAALDPRAVDYRASAPWLSESAEMPAPATSTVSYPVAPSMMVDSLAPRTRVQTLSYQTGGNP